ncbi:MAG: hypothetical protein VW625_10300, partial [Perlucidibaca sp.]
MSDTPEKRPFTERIRTFMPRSSPLNTSQQRGLDEFSLQYLLKLADGPLAPSAVFGRQAPLTVEIGFGMGQTLVQMAEDLGMATGMSPTDLKQAQATLLTFSEIAESADVAGGAFDRATQAAADLAAAGFGSAETNAVSLGRALQDPLRGLSALGRQGVTFTQEQQDLIESLVETNDMLGAQDI